MKKVVHITDKDKNTRWSVGPTDSVIVHRNFGTIWLLSKCCIYRLWCLGGIHFKRMSYIYICLVVFFVLFCQCREFDVELGDISNISDNIAIIMTTMSNLKIS